MREPSGGTWDLYPPLDVDLACPLTIHHVALVISPTRNGGENRHTASRLTEACKLSLTVVDLLQAQTLCSTKLLCVSNIEWIA